MIDPVMPTYARADLAFVAGEGPWLHTQSGERYLDFAAGIAVNALGHGHPHVVAALKDQADKLWHVSNLYRIPDQERLARRLTEASFADTVFFANSGAEAVECALKMARRYHHAAGHPQRWRVVTIEGAFHGRTLATIAAGGQARHLEGFGPPLDGFDQVPFGDHDALRAAIGPHTAALLVEPIQGEGGIRPVPDECLQGLRRLCDEAGILLILDEVQCGNGRTARLFAHEHAGIAPDILCTAKGLGNGMPIGACLAREAVAEPMKAGSHGSTFGGNPLAMAVGNAVLDVLLAPGFLDGVERQGQALHEGLEGLCAQFPSVLEGVQGRGLMLGLRARVPNTDLVAALRGQKMLTVGAGGNVVRLLPPLTIDETHVAEALNRIAAAARALTEQAPAGPSGD